MHPVRRSDLLPHIDAIVALIEASDAPELTLRDAVALLMREAPMNIEAHVIRTLDHREGVEMLGLGLMHHVQAGYGSSLEAMRGWVKEEAERHLAQLSEFVRVAEWVEELDGLPTEYEG